MTSLPQPAVPSSKEPQRIDRLRILDLDTGYGQRIELFHVIGINGLFVMRTTNAEYDEEHDEPVKLTTIECVIEPKQANELQIGLLHASKWCGERGK